MHTACTGPVTVAFGSYYVLVDVNARRGCQLVTMKLVTGRYRPSRGSLPLLAICNYLMLMLKRITTHCEYVGAQATTYRQKLRLSTFAVCYF